MQRIRSGWSVGVAAGALMLLGPASALATALSSSQHFILGRSPYLNFGADGTAVLPGVNAPNVSQMDLAGPQNWIKLDPGDVTIGDGTGSPGFEGWGPFPSASDIMNASTDPVTEIPYGPSITWNGTIHGFNWANGSFGDEYCGDFPETEGNCLMMTGEGEVKFMVVLWDVRWVPDPLTSEDDFLNAQSLLGGFDKDQFDSADPIGDPLLGGPFHVDDETAAFLSTTLLGSTDVVSGVGVKFALDPSETFTLASVWALAEDPTQYGSFADRDLITAVSVFAYFVPEPGTSVLLVSGLLGLAAFGRRRSA